MATKINNLEYDAPLEVRSCQHPAEQVIIHEVDNSTMYTTEVYTDSSKIGTHASTLACTLSLSLSLSVVIFNDAASVAEVFNSTEGKHF
jgi:hypothetical protein